MSEAAPLRDRTARSQLRLAGVLLAAVLALLAVGYILFLRPQYVVLAEGLRPADASAVIAVLEKDGRAYRLSDGGTTILVPQSDADATRVAIAGSDAAARGEIGFELFNKSDMGLTNFAQKINYQRALQGELVRTIVQMDGVESARVHIALPEKALFRGDRAEPKAAVTLTMKPGQTPDAARVAGIQRLVAAAVADLPETRVVVLDAAGRAISTAPSETANRPAALEERDAVADYYRARGRRAIEQRMPGLRFTLKVLLMPLDDQTRHAGPAWSPSGEGTARNFRLRLVLVTASALGEENQTIVRAAITEATGLDVDQGDSLWFETGPIETAAAPAVPLVPVTTPALTQTQSEPVASAAESNWLTPWLVLLGILGILALTAWRWRDRARMSSIEHQSFADRLQRQLNLSDETYDVAT